MTHLHLSSYLLGAVVFKCIMVPTILDKKALTWSETNVSIIAWEFLKNHLCDDLESNDFVWIGKKCRLIVPAKILWILLVRKFKVALGLLRFVRFCDVTLSGFNCKRSFQNMTRDLFKYQILLDYYAQHQLCYTFCWRT